MTRTRTRIALIVAGVSTALALAACGAVPQADSLDAVDAELVAFEEAAGHSQDVRPGAVRKQLRKNTLHGEMTVQAKDGVRTVVVQRGKITAVTDAGVTVESTDGFDLTWTYGDPLRVVKDREPADKAALTTGAEVGLGGVRDGAVTKARLIILK
ncbi:hypothetical protein OHA21_29850 [Actinoplanes sp. NBC_00393]|uniref:hypothetical protein n=1 Tax=Actinoplanes sp. NBC_00393 TaxID=2975953 RepID=UPI002E1B15B8